MAFQQQLSFNKALSLHKLITILIDPVLMLVTLFLSAVYSEGDFTSKYVLLSIMLFAISFPGSWENSKSLKKDILNTVTQWIQIVGILLLFGYVTGFLNIFPSEVVLLWIFGTPVMLTVSHLLASQYLTTKHYISSVKKTAVIVGVNSLSSQLQSRISTNKELGIELKGFFDVASERPSNQTSAPSSYRILGKVDEMSAYVKANSVDVIYVALPPSLHQEIMKLLDDLKDTTASIYFVPNFFIADLIQARIDDIDGMPIVAMCETPFSGFDGFVKKVSDLLLASIILCLISPILVLLGIGVKLSSPGPILFKQRRYGLDGHEIVVYKFRSMTVTEDGGHVQQAVLNDKRVTKFGKFIRKTSLDELPQFVNVLQGRMSVVGPRPHAISHNEMYRKLIKGYMVRHKVKPGITGWAQVNGFRGETESIDSMKSRIDYDLDYLRKWTLVLDIKIILKTVLLVFKDSKAY